MKTGLLRSNDGLVLKPIQEPPKGEREKNFYNRVFNDFDLNKDELKLKNFLPIFYGIATLNDSKLLYFNSFKFLKLI